MKYQLGRHRKNKQKRSDSFYLVQGVAVGLILMGIVIVVWGAFPIIQSELGYEISKHVEAFSGEPEPPSPEESFGNLLLIPPQLQTKPVNTTNAIVIDSINVNAPIVWDVSVSDKNEYNQALNNGIAHAGISDKPTKEASNTYLFAHSTLNPLEIERYSAEFTLLHRLEVGERITVFYNNKRYDYKIESKDIVRGFDTTPLTRKPDYPILTLQTCDPPGIPQNRLIITAELIEVYENI